MKKVFLSADDFGRSPNRNKAIDESFKRGLIKSSGLIVTGQFLQDAVQYLKNGNYVNHIHCHFNLSGNISDEEDIPLTECMKRDRLFCENGKFRPFVRVPSNIKGIFKFFIVYKELVAQYNKFLEITEGKGNKNHIDFHLWYNLTWSVAVALNIFTWTHKITTVRYIGVHMEHSRRRFFRYLSWNPFVKCYRSSNIDCFLTHPEWFADDEMFELYCHPDIMNGKTEILMDNSFSYFGNEKRTMFESIEQLKKFDLKFLSWGNG